MKPTHIWTNDFELSNILRRYTCCEQLCSKGGRGKHESVQRNRHTIDYAVIPQPLARIVASHVDRKFDSDGRHLWEAADPKA